MAIAFTAIDFIHREMFSDQFHDTFALEQLRLRYRAMHQLGTQARAPRISVNSRGSLIHQSPPSEVANS